jgi:hypothetical protein
MTGMSLASYMLRIVKDIVIRNPRFQRSVGDVSFTSGTSITFGNLQVLIRDINTDSTRQSFDYFISTMFGRAILTQVGDKDGAFIEYVTESDVTGATPFPGVYYFNVDSVDERTRDVGFTLETYKWYEGSVRDAEGTKIVFRSGIDATTVIVYDADTAFNAGGWGEGGFGGTATTIQNAASYLYLLENVGSILIKDASGNDLTPNTDYWIEQVQTAPVLTTTVTGTQWATIPPQFTTITLIDEDDYVLRPNQDYIYVDANTVQLSSWIGANTTISVRGVVRLDPTVPANLVNAENFLGITLLPGETLVPDQIFISTQDADHIQILPNADGSIQLPAPLPPGGWCTYEVRVLVGQSQATAKKNSVAKNLIPGLRIAIGDQVVVGDQCAIIVSPELTETYHVFGSKPGVTFTLDVKANDPTTADEISKMILEELLVSRADAIQSDGLTIFEASSSVAGNVRDDSGTAPTYTIPLSFTAAADWRVFKPLVTRITAFNVTTAPYLSPFGGRLRPTPRYLCLQREGFVPNYR